MRRENGHVSSKNIVIETNDNATDNKYEDKLDFIMLKLNKLDLLETLAK